MKILFVGHDGRDGIGNFSASLERALPQVLPPEDELVSARLTGNRARRGARIIDQQLRVPLTARDADLVHLVDFRPVLADRRPFLLTVHDVCFLDHPEWFPAAVTRYKSALLRLAWAKRPAAVVCVSHYTAARLQAHAGKHIDRLLVIPPGIDNPGYVTGEPSAEASYFLTISTIEPRKNHLGLLAAFQFARKAGLPLRWKVAGGIGYNGRPIAEALQRADGVDLLGPVGDDEREELFRSAAFVAVPSFVEGFGLPVLEAMTRGIPVIVATGSGLDEAAGEAALTVPPSEARNWADALNRLAVDLELRRSLRLSGLEHARTFDWRGAAAEYVDLYHSVAR